MPSTTEYTIGVSGAGKTYFRGPYFILNEFLLHREGILYTTLPIYPDLLAQEAARRSGRPAAEFLERMVLIPQDEIQRWEAGSSSPWQYLRGKDLRGCHIQLDECQNFLREVPGSSRDHGVADEWMLALGELRHLGATVEFISQDEVSIHSVIRAKAEVRRLIEKMDVETAFLGIPWGDILQFPAKLWGKYCTMVRVTESRPGPRGGRGVVLRMYTRLMRPGGFAYFNSRSAPVSGIGIAGSGERAPWERYGWSRLCLWFLARNWTACFRARFVVVFLGLILPLMVGMIWASRDLYRRAVGGGAPAPSATAATAPTAPGASSAGRPSPEMDELRKRLAQAEQRVVEMEAVRSEIVGLGNDRVWFSTLGPVRVGERIPGGFYRGKTLDRVYLYDNSCVIGGLRVRLGSATGLGRPSLGSGAGLVKPGG